MKEALAPSRTVSAPDGEILPRPFEAVVKEYVAGVPDSARANDQNNDEKRSKAIADLDTGLSFWPNETIDKNR